MYYSKKDKIAFYHIPKTGGTSFRSLFIKLFPDCQRIMKEGYHEPLKNKLDLIDPLANVVTVIRDPWEMIWSLYCYWRNYKGEIKTKEIGQRLEMTRSFSFNEFIYWYLDNWFSYFDYLNIEGVVPAYVHVMRLENIKKDLKRVFKEELSLTVKTNIPWLNKNVKPKLNEPLLIGMGSLFEEKFDWCFRKGYYKRRYSNGNA